MGSFRDGTFWIRQLPWSPIPAPGFELPRRFPPAKKSLGASGLFQNLPRDSHRLPFKLPSIRFPGIFKDRNRPAVVFIVLKHVNFKVNSNPVSGPKKRIMPSGHLSELRGVCLTAVWSRRTKLFNQKCRYPISRESKAHPISIEHTATQLGNRLSSRKGCFIQAILIIYCCYRYH